MSDVEPLERQIMVLDDEPLIAMASEQMIVDLGYQRVDVFFTLAEAEQAAAAQRYDVALLDVNLDANHTSHALAKTMRANGTRVVFVTGDDKSDEALCSQCDLVIGKPFGEDAILEALD